MRWTLIKHYVFSTPEDDFERQGMGCCAYPKEGVESSVLHKFCDDHDGSALGDHALQTNDVGVVELAHDWRLWQEVPPLLLRIARF